MKNIISLKVSVKQKIDSFYEGVDRLLERIYQFDLIKVIRSHIDQFVNTFNQISNRMIYLLLTTYSVIFTFVSFNLINFQSRSYYRKISTNTIKLGDKMSYLNKRNEYINVNGEKIAYRELNKGKSEIPLVMLVHLAATMDNWDPKFIDLVAEKYHIIVLDLPGVGGSEGKVATSIPGMAQQAIDIISELGYSKINLLGLSMGGMIAQEITRLANDLVEKLK